MPPASPEPLPALPRGEPVAAKPADLKVLAVLVAAVVLLSLIITVNLDLLPSGVPVGIRLLRWPTIGLAGFVALIVALNGGLTTHAKVWLVCSLWALVTTVYTIDLAPTVLRSTSFVGSVLACVWGAQLLGRSAQNRLLIQIVYACGLVFLSIAVFSAIVLVAARGGMFYDGSLFRGWFSHPNMLGAMAGVWMPTALMLRDAASTQQRRWVALAAFVLAWTVLVASRSRSGLGAALAGCTVYYACTRAVGRLGLIGLPTVTLAAALLAASPTLSSSAQRAGTELVYKGYEKDIFRSRRGHVEQTFEHIAQRPWFGFGFGTTPGMSDRPSDWKLVGLGGREKGPAYIALLEETGIVGTAILLLPVLLFLGRGLPLVTAAKPPADRRQMLASATYASALGGLINNLGEPTLWSPGSPVGAMTLFLIGATDGLLGASQARGRHA